jgi:hypothetical protein
LKKITAIFFLILFAFNWFGYRLMYDFMQQKANEQLETFLDNNSYDESQLIELKIPVHNAYQNSWASYERYNGEVELNGITYTYVKRKLSNDTLYLMCIQNSTKMRLETAKNDFFKISNDLVQNNDSKKADNSKTSAKNLQSVFYESTFLIKINSPSGSYENLWLPSEASKLHAAFHLSPEQPPDFV